MKEKQNKSNYRIAELDKEREQLEAEIYQKMKL
eukprot:CAMPEP_0202971720 /NCGR_PEP_ID=MMETSP1396-20130829/30122_1 /ASSEMBLY_ACC=CAM_ASM_000872 /TAXON_ID= /ORGANISM="Pseudokeronopsis sp., Strain Brazil" /LENGTH=32 /DNA_ID= /DNA_START= /DNA_END= /DNA_ORIENTATION=